MDKRLELIPWEDIQHDRLLTKLERYAITLRNKGKPLDEIFLVCLDKRPYEAMLLYEKLIPFCGRDDPELSRIKKYLLSSNEIMIAVRLKNEKQTKKIFYELSNTKLPENFYAELIKKLQLSNNPLNDICFLLKHSLSASFEIKENINRYISNYFCFSGAEVHDNADLREYLIGVFKDNNASLVNGMLRLFSNLNIVKLTGIPLASWRNMMLTGYFPYSTIVYKTMLDSLNLSWNEIDQELNYFISSGSGDIAQAWNDYLIFGYKVAEFPDLAEELIRTTALPPIKEMVPYGARLLCYRNAVEQTFWILTRLNPTQAFPFIDKMGKFNLARHEFQNDENMKTMRIHAQSRGYDYSNFAENIISSGIYNPQQLIDYYLNSPLRFYVDFDWYLDNVFEDSKYQNEIDLHDYFSAYTFCGIVDRHANSHNMETVRYVHLNNIYCFRRYIGNCRERQVYNELKSIDTGDLVVVRPYIFLKNKYRHYFKVNFLIDESRLLRNQIEKGKDLPLE